MDSDPTTERNSGTDLTSEKNEYPDPRVTKSFGLGSAIFSDLRKLIKLRNRFRNKDSNE